MRGTEVRQLNPLLDIKIRILQDYPVDKLIHSLGASIQSVNDIQTFRSVYYNTFLVSDWDEIKRLILIIKDSKAMDLANNEQAIQGVVDILDSTILAAAYLYERLNLFDAAQYFYSLYLDCLRPISFSSPGSIDGILGTRLMVARLKYYYLKDYARYQISDYPRYSYLNQLMDYNLSWVLNNRLQRYASVVVNASPDEAHWRHLIRESDPLALLFLSYEQCIYLIRSSEWSEEAALRLPQVCDYGRQKTSDNYLDSFKFAANIFLQVRRYSAKAENAGTPDQDELLEIERTMDGFYERHAKEAEFLVDDIEIKYAEIVKNTDAEERTLCEVARYPFPNYDFAPYAKNLVAKKGIKCD